MIKEAFLEILKVLEVHKLTNKEVLILAQELENYALIGTIEAIVEEKLKLKA